MTKAKTIYILPILFIFLLAFASAKISISISNPVDGATYTEHITELEYSVYGKFAECWYTLNDNLFQGNNPISCEEGAHKITNITSEEGKNTWTIYGMNSENELSKNEISFNVKPNKITINFPENKKTYTENITSIEFNLDYNSVQNCWYSINGEKEILLDSCSPGKNTVDNVQFNEGTNNLTILTRATQKYVKWNPVCYQLYSKSISFTLNLTNTDEDTNKTIPKIKILNPTNKTYNSLINFMNINLTMENIDSCWYTVNNNFISSFNCQNGLNIITNMNSSVGVNKLTAYAKHTNGTTIKDKVVFFVNEKDKNETDTRNPVIKIIQPTNKTYKDYLNISTFNLVEENIDYCWYQLGLETAVFNCHNGTNVINNLKTIEGVNTLTIYAKDKSNNLGKDKVVFTIKLNNTDNNETDTTAPIVTILNPLSKTYSNYLNNLEFKINDTNADICWTIINGITSSQFSCLSNSVIKRNFNSIEGKNTIFVYAKDKEGNVGASSITFWIELEKEKDKNC